MQEVGARRQARLLAWLLIALTATLAMGFFASAATNGVFSRGAIELGVLVIYQTIAYVIARSRYYPVAAYLLIGGLLFVPLLQVYTDPEADLIEVVFSFLPLAILLATALLPVRGVLISGFISSALLFFLPYIVPGTDPRSSLLAFGVVLTLSILGVVVVTYRDAVERDRLGLLRSANEELEKLKSGLEQRVEERTQALRTSAAVSQSLSQILDERELVKAVVDLVQRGFDYYHVHIYLYDEREELLRMVGGTGEPGRILLNQAHSIPRGKGLVGRAAETNNLVLVADTLSDPDWLANPLLPKTRSELAVPIAIGAKVLGVIDVQQNIVGGVTEADADLLKTIAGQVAVALRNSRAFAAAQENVAREAFLGQFSLRLQTAPTIEAVLKMAVSEVSQVLEAERGAIQIGNLYSREDDPRGGEIRRACWRPKMKAIMFTSHQHYAIFYGKLLGIIFGITFAFGFVNLLIQREGITFQVFTALAISASAFICAWLGQRGQVYEGVLQFLAVYALASAFNVVFAPVTTFLSGALYALLFILVVANLTSTTLPRTWAMWSMVAGAFVASFILLFSVYGSQVSVVNQPNPVELVIVGVLVLVFAAFIVRRFSSYSFQVKLLLVLLVTSLVPVVLLSAMNITPVLGQVRATAVLALIIILIATLVSIGISRLLTLPIVRLTNVAQRVAQGDLQARAVVETQDEIGALASSFNSMTDELQTTLRGMEQRIADRTRAIQISSDISRRLSTILDPAQLVHEVVDLLQLSYNYYHVHIYLFDEKKENLVMVGGTGEAGKTMLLQGHQIAKGRGLVGRATETGTAVIVADTRLDPNWLPNPLLPDTRSEISVPIIFGDQVLGALDVQQNIVNGLGQQDAGLLLSVTNQVAIALRNAVEFVRSQQQAQREANIRAVIDKIQGTQTVESALQVAIRELGRMVNADRTIARVVVQSGSDGDALPGAAGSLGD